MTIPSTLIALAASAAERPPLVDPVLGAIIGSVGAAIAAGLFAVFVKGKRAPADVLAAQVAADEAQARRIEADREDRKAREKGFAEAAAFIKATAESAIATYKDQQSELTATIGVLTDALEQQQRLASVQRDMSAVEKATHESTIAKLRERITSLQQQVDKLLDLTQAQQIKIAVLEGRTPVTDIDPDLFRTMGRQELDNLKTQMHHHDLDQKDLDLA
jgi:chromosome segregation ATPase